MLAVNFTTIQSFTNHLPLLLSHAGLDKGDHIVKHK